MGKVQKNEKFKKITAARVNKINDMLRLIGNCSNKNNYNYDTIKRLKNKAKKGEKHATS